MKLIKWSAGSVSNLDRSVSSDVIIQTNLPIELKDLLLGLGAIAVGIYYLMGKAYIRGAKTYEVEKTNALVDIGSMDESERMTLKDI